MHSKRKGNIGQIATALFLSKYEYSVFTEQGDISKVDLIAEKDGELITFQCKAVTAKNGALSLPLRKCGPGYAKKYEESFDFFSVYDLTNGKLYLVPSSVLRGRGCAFSLRLAVAKNCQKTNINFADDFLAEKVLEAHVNNLYQNKSHQAPVAQLVEQGSFKA